MINGTTNKSREYNFKACQLSGVQRQGLAKCGNSISSPPATVVDFCLQVQDIFFCAIILRHPGTKDETKNKKLKDAFRRRAFCQTPCCMHTFLFL